MASEKYEGDFKQFQEDLLKSIRKVASGRDDTSNFSQDSQALIDPNDHPTPEDVDFKNFLLLMEKASKSNFDISQNHPKTKYTPLHFAVTRTMHKNEIRMLKLLQVLVSHGADVNKTSQDYAQFSPIHTACRRGLPSSVNWLIEQGANPEAKHLKNGLPYKSVRDYVDKALENPKSPVTLQRFEKIDEILTNHNLQKKGWGEILGDLLGSAVIMGYLTEAIGLVWGQEKDETTKSQLEDPGDQNHSYAKMHRMNLKISENQDFKKEEQPKNQQKLEIENNLNTMKQEDLEDTAQDGIFRVQ